MKLSDLRKTLKELKNNNIYDYETKSPFYKIFTSFYDKKEAIGFLLRKIDGNIENLKDKLDPTNRNISLEVIDDAIGCLNHFKELVKIKNTEVLDYIKSLDEKSINKFLSYSKHYPSIIELDRKTETETDIFEKVYTIIDNANFTFKLDNEYFYYRIGKKQFEINIKDLEDLKNKINVPPEIKRNNEEKKWEKKIYMK